MSRLRRALTLGATVALLAAPGTAHAAPAGPWDAFNLSPSATRTQLPRAINAHGGCGDQPAGRARPARRRRSAAAGRSCSTSAARSAARSRSTPPARGQLGLAFAESSTVRRHHLGRDDRRPAQPRRRDHGRRQRADRLHDPDRAPARRLPLPDAVPRVRHVGRRRRGLGALHRGADDGRPERLRELLLLERRPAQPHLVRGRLHRADEHDRPRAGADVAGAGRAVEQHRRWSASATSILTDGAKRDRTVWPGDLGIAFPTAYTSTGDTVSTRNALHDDVRPAVQQRARSPTPVRR